MSKLVPFSVKTSSDSISIVMPAYNEEACIERVVTSWLEILKIIPGTLIVVDDGSRDRTGAILDQLAATIPQLKVIHQPNAGHGAAVVRGYREAIQLNANYVFQTDSDDQFRPEDFWNLWNNRMHSLFLLGYRKERHDALHRLVITRFVRVLLLILFGVWVKDSNIPFRLIRRDFLASAMEVLPAHAFAPNIFLSVVAAKKGCDLFSIPIGHVERKTGTVSIVRWKLVKICFRCVSELWAFRNNLASSLGRMNEHSAAERLKKVG